jgi:hypothetical protein
MSGPESETINAVNTSRNNGSCSMDTNAAVVSDHLNQVSKQASDNQIAMGN